ncbi:hypothetical protein Y1Q_0011369 [Alligator mississippiensis]|uniref:Uncharacterized protein n=1 Tax=Alligator mississippiensis TaxID=8496 RepID=A0A151MHZ8_ALLMI|nr:hypothetical protein Y1Q_0011369 [Alligator mississippiensis]
MTEAALGAEGPPGPVISAGVTPGTQTGVQGLRWSLGNSQGNTGNSTLQNPSLGYAVSMEATVHGDSVVSGTSEQVQNSTEPPQVPEVSFSGQRSSQELDETTRLDISERPSVEDVESETGSTGALATRSLKDHKGEDKCYLEHEPVSLTDLRLGSFGTCFVGLSCGTCGNCVAIGLLLVHPSLEPVWQRGAAA